MALRRENDQDLTEKVKERNNQTQCKMDKIIKILMKIGEIPKNL